MKPIYRSILFFTALLLSAGTLLAAPAETVDPQPLVPMACFAPGTDPALVEAAHTRFNESRLVTSLDSAISRFQFSDSARWSQTATDGGGLGQGDVTTITWSIVPDGTSIYGYNGEPTSNSNLRAWLNGIYGSQAVWLPIFQGVFDRWGELTGINYVYEPNDDGSAWTAFTIAAGQLGVRGDVRISAHFIDGNSNVLAYNFFPNFGDMVLDSGDNVYNNTSSSSLILRNILAHEHGHGLGLSHVCPVNQTKLMEPFLATAFDGPQFDDILATNRGYGDDLENNDTPGTASNLGSLVAGDTVAVDTISVDDNSDGDLFAFTVGGGSTLDVIVTPVGSTYLSGPQNSNGSCSAGSSYNALDNQNLAFDVLDTNGSTVLASVDATGAGNVESLSGLSLPGAGTYYVDVHGPNNEAQIYEILVGVGASGGGEQVQYDTVTSDENTRSVSLSGFSSARVVVGGPSFNGNQACTTRLTNVSNGGFDHVIDEWDYLDGAHANEDLGYIALDDGAQTLGTLDADAGTVTLNHNWTTINFAQSFSSAPVVITSVNSFSGNQAVVTRVRNVTASSFEVRLQEEEANDGTHVNERVDWIAIETGNTVFGSTELVVGRTGDSVDEVWDTVNFGQAVTGPTFLAAMQTFDGSDPSNVRYRNLTSTSVEIQVQEEQSADSEVGHTNEIVGWIVIGSP